MRVLVVEDEARLADALGQIMAEKKYAADVVYDGADGLDYARSGQYDVVVLDVMLPKLNGFEVVRRLREEKNATPVLLLTARDEVRDKVNGLDCGADDYMTKPFSPEELLARVRALARRQGEVQLETLCYDDLTLNLSTYDLTRAEKSVHLGFKEFEVLRILMSNPSIVVLKDTLISRVWGTESGAEDNNVEAYISFLRKKFAFLGSRVGITTQRKVGYRLGVEG
ncbi:MAG: response regulator transcription factor [Gemmiger sp.]|nr:response regulator transcription factor [Gemmiger sp.]